MINKMISLAMAYASRGITNKKVDADIKKLRVLSCFGNDLISPCEHLKQSKQPNRHYCGGCGCGDRKGTWLLGEGEEYSKLDFPKLGCPLKMPGFMNYDPNFINERKQIIENLDPEAIQITQITINKTENNSKE